MQLPHHVHKCKLQNVIKYMYYEVKPIQNLNFFFISNTTHQLQISTPHNYKYTQQNDTAHHIILLRFFMIFERTKTKWLFYKFAHTTDADVHMLTYKVCVANGVICIH